MKSPQLPLQIAVYSLLSQKIPYPVHDDFPQEAPYPYVVTGDASAVDWSDKFKAGQGVSITVHVWSQYRGRKEACEIIDLIIREISASTPDLAPDFNVVQGRLESSQLFMDIDGKTRHGVITWKYLIEEL